MVQLLETAESPGAGEKLNGPFDAHMRARGRVLGIRFFLIPKAAASYLGEKSLRWWEVPSLACRRRAGLTGSTTGEDFRSAVNCDGPRTRSVPAVEPSECYPVPSCRSLCGLWPPGIGHEFSAPHPAPGCVIGL